MNPAQPNTGDQERKTHTSGEWLTHIGQDGGLFVRDKQSHRLIAGFQTSTLNERMPEGEGEANAALFMASREMLAALKDAKREIEWLCEQSTLRFNIVKTRQAYLNILAAIDRAEAQ